MNIKKTIVLLLMMLTLMTALPCVCLAAPEVSVRMAEKMCEVTISEVLGEQHSNESVNLYMSGDCDDELTQVSAALIHADSKNADEGGKYSFEFYLKSSVSGKIPYIIKTPGYEYRSYINVVSYDDADGILNAIKNGDGADTAAKLEGFEPYIAGVDFSLIDKTKLAQSLIADGMSTDVPSLISAITRLSVVPMLNGGHEDIFSGARFRYPSELGLSDDECALYDTKISQSGLENIKKGMLKRNFAGDADACAQFRRLIYINCITNNTVLGVNDTENILITHADLLGIDINLYKNCTDKPSAINKLVNSGAGDVDSFIANYNKAFVNKPAQSNSAGGTGGGGGGAGGGTSGQRSIVSVPFSNVLPDNGNVENSGSDTNKFEDMNGFEWAENAVYELKKANVINGKADNCYAPADYVTREEFTAMVARILGIAENDSINLPFTDTDKMQWYYGSVAAAYDTGIVNGYGEKFGIGENVTRQDAAAIILRMIRAKGIETADVYGDVFADDADIADYAYEAVYSLKKHGIIGGYPDGNFAPNGFLNRAETAQMLCGAKAVMDKRQNGGN